MTRPPTAMTLAALPWLLLALPLPPAPAAAGGREMLADSSFVESWALGNGLRVLTRDIPGCRAVSITVGYGTGTSADPPGNEGLAMLLAEVAFTAPAGEIPARTREEMESLRPLGWSLKVSQRATLLSEVASPEQAPGALRQIATRMRGVTVTGEVLAAAIATVRRDLGQHFMGAADQALYYQVRELGAHGDDATTLRLASGGGFDWLTAEQVQERLDRLYVPANAVLGLAGDLSGLNLHLLLESEFGSIPPGAVQAEPPAAPLTSHSRAMQREGLAGPQGVVGLIAPAITDSLHPSFYLNLLLLGSHVTSLWNRPGNRPAPRFQYSIFDDPELARFYPPVGKNETSPGALGTALANALDVLQSMTVSRDTYDELRDNVAWLLGGPMSRAVRGRVLTDSGALNLISTSVASRGLWGGEEFWSGYLARIQSLAPGGINRWAPYFVTPENQVRLLFTPRK